MKPLAVVIVAALIGLEGCSHLSSHPRNEPLTKAEKLEVYDRLASFDVISAKITDVNNRINTSPLGKELNDINAAGRAVQDKINASPDGKELAELNKKAEAIRANFAKTDLFKEQQEAAKQSDKFVADYNVYMKALSDKHGAPGCGLSRTLEWTGCPAEKQAKK